MTFSENSNDSESNSIPIDPPDSLTEINNLPYEILAPIFESIPVPKRNIIRSVCKRWKDILDTMVGMEVRIGTMSEFDPLWEQEESLIGEIQTQIPVYQDPKIICEAGVESCLVGNISDEMQTATGFYGLFQAIRNIIFGPQKTLIPAFKYPELVNKIYFNGYITPVYFTSLMSELPYLTILTLHLFSLNALEEHCLKPLDLPNLEKLIIMGGNSTKVYNIQHRIFREWDTNSIVMNMITLTENTFPKLKAVAIEYIYDMDKQLQINRSILQFLQRHSSTMKRFNLQYSLVINEDFFHDDDVSIEHPSLLEIANQLHHTLQFECLQILPFYLPVLPYYSSVWSPIIREQKSLKMLSVVGVLYRSDFLQRIVDLNFSTLRNLCISRIVLFENLTPLQFDCGILGSCENLKFLALRGWTVTLTVRALINVDQLPKSLVEIDLGDMAIGTEDIRILALEMPLLEELELRFVGTKRDLGMNEATLREIIQRRQLKTCFLQRAFNGKLEDGIYNGDSDDPDYITESVGGFIGFRKTKKGIYKRMSMSLKMF